MAGLWAWGEGRSECDVDGRSGSVLLGRTYQAPCQFVIEHIFILEGSKQTEPTRH